MAKQSLLLVDGDTRSVRVLEVSLRKAGFTVTTAVSVADALDKLALHTPDLIISETAFGDGDGFELRRRVRTAAAWAEIPFLFLTADTAIEDKIDNLKPGVDDYLTKPIYIKEIVSRIQMLLEKRQRPGLEERRDLRSRFAGRVADMPVVDVIQTIEISRKSGVIQFVGDRGRQAAIYFRDGRVIDAEAGALQGEDAVYRLLTWSDGEFEVVFRTVRRREVIATTSQSLLMEGMRRLDEWSRLLEQLPALGHRFEVDASELALRLGDVPDDNNRILRLIDGKRTLMEVIDASDVGDLECLQAVSRLYFEELLVDLDHGQPSNREPERSGPIAATAEVPRPFADNPSGPVAEGELAGQVADDDQPDVISEEPAPGALLGGYRPSSLRLIDEAVAAAQAIEPSLFEDDPPPKPAGNGAASRAADDASLGISRTSTRLGVPAVSASPGEDRRASSRELAREPSSGSAPTGPLGTPSSRTPTGEVVAGGRGSTGDVATAGRTPTGEMTARSASGDVTAASRTPTGEMTARAPSSDVAAAGEAAATSRTAGEATAGGEAPGTARTTVGDATAAGRTPTGEAPADSTRPSSPALPTVRMPTVGRYQEHLAVTTRIDMPFGPARTTTNEPPARRGRPSESMAVASPAPGRTSDRMGAVGPATGRTSESMGAVGPAGRTSESMGAVGPATGRTSERMGAVGPAGRTSDSMGAVSGTGDASADALATPSARATANRMTVPGGFTATGSDPELGRPPSRPTDHLEAADPDEWDSGGPSRSDVMRAVSPDQLASASDAATTDRDAAEGSQERPLERATGPRDAKANEALELAGIRSAARMTAPGGFGARGHATAEGPATDAPREAAATRRAREMHVVDLDEYDEEDDFEIPRVADGAEAQDSTSSSSERSAMRGERGAAASDDERSGDRSRDSDDSEDASGESERGEDGVPSLGRRAARVTDPGELGLPPRSEGRSSVPSLARTTEPGSNEESPAAPPVRPGDEVLPRIYIAPGRAPTKDGIKDDTSLRMIGSLGRDRAEASGELVPAGGPARALSETQRELVTILPRRITREIAAATAAGDAETATPVEPPASEGVAPREAPPRPRTLSEGSGVRRVSGPGTGALAMIVLAAVLAGLAVYLRLRRTPHVAQAIDDASVEGEPQTSPIEPTTPPPVEPIADADEGIEIEGPDARSAELSADAASGGEPHGPRVDAGAMSLDAAAASARPDPAQATAIDAGIASATAVDAGTRMATVDAGTRMATVDAGTRATDAGTRTDASADVQQAKLLMEQAHDALQEGDFAKALELADGSLKLRRTARTYLVRAQALQRLDRVDEALAAIDQAQKVAPTYAQVYEQRGRVLWAARRKDEAREAFAKFLELEPDGPRAAAVQRLLNEPR